MTTVSANNTPLPTTLGDTQVLVDDVPAPLFYVSPSQINLQLAPGLVGDIPIKVVSKNTEGISTTVTVLSEAPEIFVSGTAAAVLNQDYSLNSPANPAAIGSAISIYATGLGSTNPTLAAGQAGASNPPFNTTAKPVTVLINGQSVPASFAAIAPGFVGLYQVNVTIPAITPVSDSVSLQIQINGQLSNSVTFATRPL